MAGYEKEDRGKYSPAARPLPILFLAMKAALKYVLLVLATTASTAPSSPAQQSLQAAAVVADDQTVAYLRYRIPGSNTHNIYFLLGSAGLNADAKASIAAVANVSWQTLP